MKPFATILTGISLGCFLLANPAAAAPVKLHVISCDSEETQSSDDGQNGRAANAVDGNPNTVWHTQWQDGTPGYPHEIVIELSEPATIQGFTYLPRQDGNTHGMIKDYELYLSQDGKDFGTPVAKGSFEQSADKKTITFDAHKCHYVKLRALSEVTDGPWASAAELNIVQGEGQAAEAPAPAATATASSLPAATASGITLRVASVDSEETGTEENGQTDLAGNAVDGDPKTFWHTQWKDATPGCPHEIVIVLSAPATLEGVTYLPRQDDIENGMIKDYELYLSDDGKDFGSPVAKGTFAAGADKKTISFAAKQCRYFKLRALSEINDGAWTSAAEINIVPAKGTSTATSTATPAAPASAPAAAASVIKLTAVQADSEEAVPDDNGQTGRAANAVDGDTATYWHTQWQSATPDYPHEIIIALSEPAALKGVTYLPRQDEMDHGNIKDYELYLSDDGKNFGSPVAKGTFAAGKEKKTIAFEPKQCRYFKLRALSEINDGPWAAAAEIGIIR